MAFCPFGCVHICLHTLFPHNLSDIVNTTSCVWPRDTEVQREAAVGNDGGPDKRHNAGDESRSQPRTVDGSDRPEDRQPHRAGGPAGQQPGFAGFQSRCVFEGAL